MNSFLCSCFWSSRPKIPEEYLRPQGLYSLERVDLKKLKRLIRNQQLAPCHPGVEEPTQGQDLEECPICFLHYPVLNSSLCCQKRVCTECFLQVQTSTPPHQLSACPFCKVTRPTGYLVKLIGARSAEEKEQERVEEQKVIEARIREREEEIRRDQERALQRQQQQQLLQQQQHAVAVAGAGNGNSATHQQPSAGVMAAAAAAASALEPSGGGGNAANAASPVAGGRAAAAGRGSATAVTAAAAATDPSALGINGSGGGGSHYTVHYQSGDRHRSPAGTASAAGGPNATVILTSGGGGASVYPTASARRAAAVAAISAAIQQHQLQQQPGDRYRAGPDAVGGGGHPDGPDGTGTGTVGHHPRRNPQGAGAGGRRYRLTDYVPAGVVDIAMGLDDINDLMLEQAMYESLAEAAATSSPPAAAAATGAPTAVAAASSGGGSGGNARAADGSNADLDNDAALAEALAASLNGVGESPTDSAPMAERSPVPPAASPRPSVSAAAAGVGSSLPPGRPMGRPGWRHTSVRSGQLTATGQPTGDGHSSSVSTRSGGGGGGATTAPSSPSPSIRSARASAVSSSSSSSSSRQAAAVMMPTPPPLESSRAQQQQQQQAAGTMTPTRVGVTARPAAPSHQPSFPGSSSTTTATTSLPGAPQIRGERRELRDGRGQLKIVAETEEEEGEALFSRRTGAVVASALPVTPGLGPSSSSPSSAPPRRAAAMECPMQEEEEADAASAPGRDGAVAVAASAVVLLFPGRASVEQAGLLAAAADAPGSGTSGATCGIAPASAGGPTTTTISPVPSDSPVGALGPATSDLSVTGPGSLARRGGLLDGVTVSGVGVGEQHVTNPLYDIWSNSSSATTCKHSCLAGMGQEEAARPGGSAAAGGSSSAAAAPSAAVLAHWGVKCGGSRHSSLGSDGGMAAQPVPHGQQQQSAQQPQQQEAPKVLPLALATSPPGDRVDLTDSSCVTSNAPTQPLRPPALALDSTGPTSPTAVATCCDIVTPASPAVVPTPSRVPTPSPRLALPPLGLPPPASVAVHGAPPAPDTPLADAAAADAHASTTVVTIQTLAAELLRHGSGAATTAVAAAAGSADGSSASLQVFAVGMVFLVPDSAGASCSQQPGPQQPLEGPAWVENPDGSLQVLLPAGGSGGGGGGASGSSAIAPGKQPARHRWHVANSDEVMDLPYTDSELPELQPLPSLGPLELNVQPDAAYIAIGGNEPAPLSVGGTDPPGEAEAVDEALVQECNKTDAALKELVAAYDVAVLAAIAAGDRLVRGVGGSAGSGPCRHPESGGGGQ